MSADLNFLPDVAPETIDDLMAVQRLLLLTQTEIQKLLNKKGLKYRDLAKRIGVTEARVSQIFSEKAGNLTIRTIARIFHGLNEEAYITSAREFFSAGAKTEPQEERAEPWEIIALGSHYVTINMVSSPVVDIPQDYETIKSGASLQKWALADRMSNDWAA